MNEAKVKTGKEVKSEAKVKTGTEVKSEAKIKTGKEVKSEAKVKTGTEGRKWIKHIELNKCLPCNEFPYFDKFIKLGDCYKTINQRILWDIILSIDRKEYNKRQNCVYLITMNHRIIKIGGTKTGMKNRINSYFCGHCTTDRKKQNGENYPGKMSVTNAILYNTILSYITNGKKISFYYYPIEDIIININVFDNIKNHIISLY